MPQIVTDTASQSTKSSPHIGVLMPVYSSDDVNVYICVSTLKWQYEQL